MTTVTFHGTQANNHRRNQPNTHPTQTNLRTTLQPTRLQTIQQNNHQPQKRLQLHLPRLKGLKCGALFIEFFRRLRLCVLPCSVCCSLQGFRRPCYRLCRRICPLKLFWEEACSCVHSVTKYGISKQQRARGVIRRYVAVSSRQLVP